MRAFEVATSFRHGVAWLSLTDEMLCGLFMLIIGTIAGLRIRVLLENSISSLFFCQAMGRISSGQITAASVAPQAAVSARK